MSSSSGSTLNHGAGSVGPVDKAIPKGDNASMEVEDELMRALQSSCLGDSSTPGDVLLKDVSADAGLSVTEGV